VCESDLPPRCFEGHDTNISTLASANFLRWRCDVCGKNNPTM
ncbi:25605_t:CDS:1, partial [Gigaspora rosea]